MAGVGSRDGVAYHSDIYFEREFTHWREGVGFDLQIGPPPRKTVWISWNIAPQEESVTELSIMVTPILDSHLLEVTKTSYVQKYFGESLVVYLDSLLRGVAYFLKTGKSVELKTVRNSSYLRALAGAGTDPGGIHRGIHKPTIPPSSEITSSASAALRTCRPRKL